jgi:hypothetical protein
VTAVHSRALHMTGAALLVSRGMKLLQAASAVELVVRVENRKPPTDLHGDPLPDGPCGSDFPRRFLLGNLARLQVTITSLLFGLGHQGRLHDRCAEPERGASEAEDAAQACPEDGVMLPELLPMLAVPAAVHHRLLNRQPFCLSVCTSELQEYFQLRPI